MSRYLLHASMMVVLFFTVKAGLEIASSMKLHVHETANAIALDKITSQEATVKEKIARQNEIQRQRCAAKGKPVVDTGSGTVTCYY